MNKLQQEIKNKHDEYVELNYGRKPLFVDVAVRFNGQDVCEDATIKLVPSTEQEQNGEGDDNEIFFYCNHDGLYYIDVVKGIDDKESGYDNYKERKELEEAAKRLFG